MKVERLEISNKEKSQKKKFSKRASSSLGKRSRESPTESVQGSATRGRRQGSTVISSSGRGASAGQGEISECPHFNRRHLGICRLLKRGCFRCGSTDHFIAQCPPGDNRSQQGSGRGRSATPPSTRDRSRGQGSPFQHRG